MKPLFEWDSDGEQTLKALPHVVDWFLKELGKLLQVILTGKIIMSRRDSYLQYFSLQNL